MAQFAPAYAYVGQHCLKDRGAHQSFRHRHNYEVCCLETIATALRIFPLTRAVSWSEYSGVAAYSATGIGVP